MKKKIFALASIVCALTMCMAVGCNNGDNNTGDTSKPGDDTTQNPGDNTGDNNDNDDKDDENDNDNDNDKTPTAHTNTYDYSAITKVADKTVLTQASFVGANAFLKVNGEKNVTYRDTAACIETKEDGLSVVFQGTGTITVEISSTGKANYSGFALVAADGTYLVATSTGGSGTVKKLDADETPENCTKANKAGTYVCGDGSTGGTTHVTLTFEVKAAGEYTLYSIFNYYDSSKSQESARGCRIFAISMVDNY